MFGHPPNRQALFKLRKRVTVETRAAKHKPAAAKPGSSGAGAREAEAELTAWVRRASDEQVQGLAGLGEAVEAYAAEHPEAHPMGLPPAAERAEVMRAAVAEVQRQNSAWTRAKLEFELYRQMPVLPRWADWGRYLVRHGRGDPRRPGRGRERDPDRPGSRRRRRLPAGVPQGRHQHLPAARRGPLRHRRAPGPGGVAAVDREGRRRPAGHRRGRGRRPRRRPPWTWTSARPRRDC